MAKVFEGMETGFLRPWPGSCPGRRGMEAPAPLPTAGAGEAHEADGDSEDGPYSPRSSRLRTAPRSALVASMA